MLFVLPTPSLQHLAAVKIVTHLWKRRDIFIRIAQFYNDRPTSQLTDDVLRWHYIEDIYVRNKIWALALPELIKKDLLRHFVQPIGIEVIAWCRYHNLGGNLFTFLDTRLPPQLCWTMHGTVDYATTAAILVTDERLNVERRFEIACLNCLENEARNLFQSIPNFQIQRYIKKKPYYLLRELPVVLIVYFSCSFQGVVSQYVNRLFESMYWPGGSTHQYVFQIVSSEGSRATCGYFLEKLEPEEKERALVGSQLRQFRQKLLPPTCCIMYGLSLMNEWQQEQMFDESSSDLLTILLRWPMQCLFVDAAERAWRYLEEGECTQLLKEIVAKIRFGYRDYDYAYLFFESWRLTSADSKQHFFKNFHHLKSLFATKQEDMIKFILNEAPARQLKKLIENSYDIISPVLMDESSISDAALMACKQTAELNSSKDRNNIEKEMRSDYVGFLVDLAMENRSKSREIAGCATST